MKLRKSGGVFSGTGAVSVELRENIKVLLTTFVLYATHDVYTTVALD